MSLQAPYYLAVGNVIIESGDGDGIYKTVTGSVSFPAPDERESDTSPEPHNDAVRSFAVKIRHTDPAVVKEAFNTLSRACRKGSMLRFRDGETDDLLECRVIRGRVSESSYDPLRRQRLTGYTIIAEVTLITDPYWMGPWSTEATIADGSKVPSAVFPFYATVAAVGGDVDAILTATVLPAQATSMIALGVFPDVGEDFDPIDDYSGTTDAAAYGGAKATSGSLTTTFAAIGSAPTIPTAGNRGTHVAQVRIANTAAAAGSAKYRTYSTTNGSAIVDSTSVSGPIVAAAVKSGDGFEVATLGLVDIPCAQMPDVKTESGFGAPALDVVSQLAGSSYTSAISRAAAETQAWVPEYSMLVTGMRFHIKNAATVPISIGLFIQDRAYGYNPPTTYASLRVDAPASSDGLLEYVLDDYFVVNKGQQYFLNVVGNVGNVTVKYASGSNPFAKGQRYRSVIGAQGWAVTSYPNDDLIFEVDGMLAFGFDSTLPVLASCSESTKTASLDVLTRIPVDGGAFVCTSPFSAGLGVRFAGDTRRAYHADADGIGHALLSQTKLFGFPRLRPGVPNAIVVNAATPATAAPTGATVKYTYRERYLNAVKD